MQQLFLLRSALSAGLDRQRYSAAGRHNQTETFRKIVKFFTMLNVGIARITAAARCLSPFSTVPGIQRPKKGTGTVGKAKTAANPGLRRSQSPFSDSQLTV